LDPRNRWSTLGTLLQSYKSPGYSKTECRYAAADHDLYYALFWAEKLAVITTLFEDIQLCTLAWHPHNAVNAPDTSKTLKQSKLVPSGPFQMKENLETNTILCYYYHEDQTATLQASVTGYDANRGGPCWGHLLSSTTTLGTDHVNVRSVT
jgi:hypothetical protein